MLGNTTEAQRDPSEFLTGGSVDASSTTGLSEMQEAVTSQTGEDRAGTRNKFGNHVFPTSIDPGQDVLKFNMMKYVPKNSIKKHLVLKIELKDTRKKYW